MSEKPSPTLITSVTYYISITEVHQRKANLEIMETLSSSGGLLNAPMSTYVRCS